MKKRAFEFSFAWLFAIFAGATILFLALYATSRIVSIERYQHDTETAKQLNMLIEPFAISLEEGKAGVINVGTETTIYNSCFSEGEFGWQELRVSSKQTLGGKSKAGVEEKIKEKYIFSGQEIEGKKFWIVSMPLEMPFKIADLLMVSSEKYCFFRPPNDVQEKISGLSKNIEITDNQNCSDDSIIVCFDTESYGNKKCNISVYGTCINPYCENKFETGYVKKGTNKTYYIGTLLFASIFSDKHVYECNIKRIGKRMSHIAEILFNKARIMNSRGCNTNVMKELIALRSIAQSIATADEPDSMLVQLWERSKELERKNDMALCKIY